MEEYACVVVMWYVVEFIELTKYYTDYLLFKHLKGERILEAVELKIR